MLFSQLSFLQSQESDNPNGNLRSTTLSSANSSRSTTHSRPPLPLQRQQQYGQQQYNPVCQQQQPPPPQYHTWGAPSSPSHGMPPYSHFHQSGAHSTMALPFSPNSTSSHPPSPVQSPVGGYQQWHNQQQLPHQSPYAALGLLPQQDRSSRFDDVLSHEGCPKP